MQSASEHFLQHNVAVYFEFFGDDVDVYVCCLYGILLVSSHFAESQIAESGKST